MGRGSEVDILTVDPTIQNEEKKLDLTFLASGGNK